MTRSTLTYLAEGVGEAFAQLGKILGSDEAYRGVMLELGWKSDTIPPAIAALQTPVDQLAAVLGDGTIDVDELDDVLDAIQRVIDAVHDLQHQASSLPSELVADGFDAIFATQLIDFLLIEFLEERYPLAISLMAAVGIVHVTELDADGNRPGSIQHAFAWADVPKLLSDPRQLFVNAYGWGGDDFAHGLLLELLMNVGESLNLSMSMTMLEPEMREVLEAGTDEWAEDDPVALQLPAFESDDAEMGVLLYGLPQLGARPPGIAILPYGSAGLDAAAEVSENFTLELHTELDLDGGVAMLLRPGEPIEVLSDIVQSGGAPVGEGEVRAVLSYRSDTEQHTLLLGSSDGTRFEATGVSFTAGVLAEASTSDLYLETAIEGGRLVLSTADAGAFVAKLLGSENRTVELGPTLGWSTERGAYFKSGDALVLRLPFHLRIGPITIEDVFVEIIPLPEIISVEIGAGVLSTLGPFATAIDKMGLTAELSFPDGGGNLGPIRVAVAFMPPTTIVFAVESDAVTGGGFVQLDPELGRYSGGLALDVFGVGISAVVIVDTKAIGVPSGFALFASLGVTFASPLPIGFGFTLIGVGGLLALNRTIGVEALASGIKTGAADAVLFPDNILADAAAILDGLDQWFPSQEDTTVVGPVVEIGWGSPTLISAEVGVIVALPDLIVTLLGSVEVLLPTPDEALLSLRMDVLGAVDVPASTVTVSASLHNSNLLGVFELSGDMGFHARLSGTPLFVLSVGGYHPQFDPPGAMPSWLLELRRTRAAVPLGIAVEVVLTSYVAVTSNSVQFGGRFKLVASVEVLLTTYTAEGWFGINILLVLKPFKIVAGATAGVAIYAGERELMGVQLRARLEGPEPWYSTGSASFNFFGLDVDFGFEIGSQPGGEPREVEDVGDDVARAMQPPSGWQTSEPRDPWATGVVISDQLPEGFWVRPDQNVDVRQSVAPLNRTITAYGEFIPESDRIEAKDVTLSGEIVDEPVWIEDWFAPAQFDRLDDSASLASPSYELMTAGVRFGDDDVGISPIPERECTSVSRAPEVSVYPDAPAGVSKFVSPIRVVPDAISRRTVRGPSLDVSPTSYSVIQTLNGRDAGLAAETSYRDAVASVEPSERSRVRVAPSHAVIRAS